ncbi:MAG TPA: hypothetical protein DEA08_36325 [Planctomycetes bacterium]|nr:hypothetical protein [Planctomycetota bacterium]
MGSSGVSRTLASAHGEGEAAPSGLIAALKAKGAFKQLSQESPGVYVSGHREGAQVSETPYIAVYHQDSWSVRLDLGRGVVELKVDVYFDSSN